MTKIDLIDALKSLGWAQAEFARRLGVHANTVSSWATGAVEVPGYAEEYLRVVGLAREVLR